MSTITEDDTELRDLVAKVLDGQGVLGKLKAQLRAHVYTVLEQGDKISSPLVNRNLRDYLATTSGRLVASLVREFLEFFSLDFTLAVFDPETNIGKDFSYRGRDRLIEALGLTELVDTKAPLLSEVMRLSKVSVLKSESPTPTEITGGEEEEEEDNSSQQASLPHDQYSDFKRCERVEESHNNSNSSNNSSLTPEMPAVELGSLALVRQPDRLLDVTYPPEPGAAASSSRPAGAAAAAAAGSLLSDLPPLGSLPHRGELPPLNGARPPLGLAPLKKVPPLAKPEVKAVEDNTRPADKTGVIVAAQQTAEEARLKQTGEGVGTSSSRQGGGKEEEEAEQLRGDKQQQLRQQQPEELSVSEEIEEDLDSFLNTSQSGAEEFTREENLAGSDASLKADYVESL